MNRLFGMFVVLVVVFFTLFSCTTEKVVEKEHTIREEIYITNYTTNVEYYYTNTPYDVVDTDVMASLQGWWFVYEETTLAFTNDTNGNPVVYVQTNTWSSTNSVGACLYQLRSDGYVNFKYYTTNNGWIEETNVFKWWVLSNDFGRKIDFEVLALQEVSEYVLPVGTRNFLPEPTNEIIVKTNYRSNYTVTNVIYETNIVYSICVETNDWEYHIERTRYFYSFSLGLITNISNEYVEQYWTPDTNTYSVIVSGNVRSSRNVVEHTAVMINSTNFYSSFFMNFSLMPYDTKKLRKLE